MIQTKRIELEEILIKNNFLLYVANNNLIYAIKARQDALDVYNKTILYYQEYIPTN